MQKSCLNSTLGNELIPKELQMTTGVEGERARMIKL